MSLIYQPRGRAAEYSPLALNLFSSCTHGCAYCYVPRVLKRTDFFSESAKTRVGNVLRTLERELSKGVFTEQILMSFVGDCYAETDQDGRDLVRGALELLDAHGCKVAILTKGGSRCLEDLRIFKKFGERIAVGASLTFFDEKKSKEWEPGGASPRERIETLAELKRNGIRTFASAEPVIEPSESLAVISSASPYVDFFKIGKLNNYKGLDKEIDWSAFSLSVCELLRSKEKPFYIKDDLARAANGVEFREEERKKELYFI